MRQHLIYGLLAVCGVLGVGVAAVPVEASPCGVFYPNTYAAPAYNYNDYEVKKRVVVLEYALIPAFPIGYAPAATPQAASAPTPSAAGAHTPCDAKLAEITAKLAALEARLSGKMPPVEEKDPSPTKTTTLVGKCAGCHDSKVSAEKGSGISLFSEGKPTLWSDGTAGKVLRAVSSGKMPKGSKLTPEEFSQLAQELFDVTSK